MRMNLLRAFALIAIAGTLSACLGGPTQRAGTVGGEYLVFRHEGLPERGGAPATQPARWSEHEFRDLEDLEAACARQADAQLPDPSEQIATVASRNLVAAIPGAYIGTRIGATSVKGISPHRYGKYAAGSAGGSAAAGGAAGGVAVSETTWNYGIYACMQANINFVTDQTGRLGGIFAAPYAGTGKSRGVPNPGATSDTSVPAKPARNSNTGAIPLP